jgi:uncharacterized BrkB/YihY/UPF0761 family membrane protein
MLIVKNQRNPIQFVLSSLLASLGVGAVVGAMICLVLLGFSWWASIPTVSRQTWVYIPAVTSGMFVWFYVAWLFFTGASSPEEMGERLKDYFQYGIDGD